MNFTEEEAVKEITRIKRNTLIIISTLIVLIIGLIGCGVYRAFWDMNRLPKGDLIMKSSSPDGRYTVKAYLSGGGGATTDFAIRAELVTHTGVLQRSKNIYWNYHEQSANIKWIDRDTVDINGHILDLPYDKFDFRISSHWRAAIGSNRDETNKIQVSFQKSSRG